MTIANANTEYRDLPLSVLTESKTNPRRFFEDSALNELAESLEVIQRTSAVLLAALEEPSPEDSPVQTAETATPTATEDAAPEPRRSRRTRNEAATTEAAA